jgi:hypothetical protein
MREERLDPDTMSFADNDCWRLFDFELTLLEIRFLEHAVKCLRILSKIGTSPRGNTSNSHASSITTNEDCGKDENESSTSEDSLNVPSTTARPDSRNPLGARTIDLPLNVSDIDKSLKAVLRDVRKAELLIKQTINMVQFCSLCICLTIRSIIR